MQQGEPRCLTQLASLEVYKAGLSEIYYSSRYGNNLENWALFEPFDLEITKGPEAVRPDDPDLQEAWGILGIVITSE